MTSNTRLTAQPVNPIWDNSGEREPGHFHVTATEKAQGIDHLASADPSAQGSWTLCGLRASRQKPTFPFRAPGCWTCTNIAFSTGYTVADDTFGGVVDLMRWRGRQPAQPTAEALAVHVTGTAPAADLKSTSAAAGYVQLHTANDDELMTPDQARQVAAALLAKADEVEAREAQWRG